ncbi:beta-channel forming cytolysin CPB (plasmid) [Clostridium perfringens]|uniref:Beta toxin n=3 Tax=Clostridium perfringens TaxID=1502 RepID=A0A0C4ZKF5_CLOPF|nr:beta-channel forming cytolysin CPB [Clostridium perfringens]AJI77134.1 beta toxin [Clostridium perfringens]EDS79310.1 beta-toxin [Clostridium perfringens C str. JGS1495]PWX16795.1 beta-channel forming cytolysin [Clostridium perfringens]
MKKKFISLVIVSSLLNGCLLSPTLVYANDIGKTTTITRNNTSDGYTIITQNDKQIISYQSVDSSSKNEDGFTASIDARFIDDKYSSEMTTLINLTGFMSSKKEDVIKKYNLHDVTNSTAINFPVRYSISILNESINENVKIVDSIPKNTISQKTVSNTMGYKIGGSIKIEENKPKASIESEYAESSTIEYIQPDFSTIQTDHSTSKASWDTKFTETTRGNYNLKSNNPVYGNEMFMYGRYTNVPATENIIPDYQMSKLITGGLNPNMSVVLTAPNGTEESIIKVKMERERNCYYLNWNGVNWVGQVYSRLAFDTPNVDSHIFTFKINWLTHKVTAI